MYMCLTYCVFYCNKDNQDKHAGLDISLCALSAPRCQNWKNKNEKSMNAFFVHWFRTDEYARQLTKEAHEEKKHTVQLSVLQTFSRECCKACTHNSLWYSWKRYRQYKWTDSHCCFLITDLSKRINETFCSCQVTSLFWISYAACSSNQTIMPKTSAWSGKKNTSLDCEFHCTWNISSPKASNYQSQFNFRLKFAIKHIIVNMY